MGAALAGSLFVVGGPCSTGGLHPSRQSFFGRLRCRTTWAARRRGGHAPRSRWADGRSALVWDSRLLLRPLAFRGGFPLAALASSAVLFSVLCSRAPFLRCLSFRPLRYVGRISYGMYLWHSPLFMYLDHARTGLIEFPLFAGPRRRHPGGRHGVLLRD